MPCPSLWCSWAVVLIIFRGQDPGLLAYPCGPLWLQIFIVFLTSSWDPNFPDSGANLAPTWSQLGATIHPNPCQEGSKFQANLHHVLNAFFLDFGSLLNRNLVDFGPQVEGQVDQKINEKASCWQVGRNSKNTKNTNCFSMFLVPRPSKFGSKIVKKASPGRQKNQAPNARQLFFP